MRALEERFWYAELALGLFRCLLPIKILSILQKLLNQYFTITIFNQPIA